MTTGTDLALAPPAAATLFNGATPDEVIAAATEVANRFSHIVKEQKLFQSIGGRNHVLIEGWQTIGALVGVFAVKDVGVTQLPWPHIAPLGERPQVPEREPPRSAPTWPEWKEASDADRRWRHHRDLIAARDGGLAFGFTASYRAVKDGAVIGWGEGRCDRTETKWVNRDNTALVGMTETRGQSRTYNGPLRFMVKLAGYSGTPAEDMDDPPEPKSEPAQVATLDNAGEEEVTRALEATWPDLDAVKFAVKLEKRFGGAIPQAAGDALRAWAWFAKGPGLAPATPVQAPQEPAGEATEATADVEPTREEEAAADAADVEDAILGEPEDEGDDPGDFKW